MGDGGIRSRKGERQHDVFSRTKHKVKAMIEAHKALLLEDLHDIMAKSSLAIYDAVVVCTLYPWDLGSRVFNEAAAVCYATPVGSIDRSRIFLATRRWCVHCTPGVYCLGFLATRRRCVYP